MYTSLSHKPTHKVMDDAVDWHVSVGAGFPGIGKKQWVVFSCQWTLVETRSPSHVLKTHGGCAMQRAGL